MWTSKGKKQQRHERRANGINILEPLKWILFIYIELRIHGHEVDEPPSKTAG